ncbi:MAG TPA: hypothetical protein VJX70_14345 [Candidatus Acidoferrum sp.]|nr:hypothetical protein [Candidatus Acidoferrum sp.]
MRALATATCLASLVLATSAWAQTNPSAPAINSTQRRAEATSPDRTATYCSGFVTDDKVPSDVRLISGEESNSKVVFVRGDYVFINRGSAQGVRVGDRFSLVRPDKDPDEVQWFKWQQKLMKAMGTRYIDAGELEVTGVQANVSTAIIKFSCDYMQRGDIALPLTERPTPPYKSAEKFDRFAPVSGKSVGMLVTGLEYANAYGKNSTVYVNLGTNQGVKVGDYFRVFRYQGSTSETPIYFADYQYSMYGFGSTPVKYKWNDLPREVIGEGIVMNVSRNSSTMFITYSKLEMYAGDYVEIE